MSHFENGETPTIEGRLERIMSGIEQLQAQGTPVPLELEGDQELPYDMPDLPEPGEDGVIPPQFVPDENIANDTLRHLGYWYSERERVQLQASRERARIDDLERRQLTSIEHRIAWHEGGLRSFLDATGKRAWKGLRGSVSWRKGRQRVEVTDEVAFIAWAEAEPEDVQSKVLKRTTEVSKSGIAEWIKGDGAGEMPAGVELMTGDQKLVISVEE